MPVFMYSFTSAISSKWGNFKFSAAVRYTSGYEIQVVDTKHSSTSNVYSIFDMLFFSYKIILEIKQRHLILSIVADRAKQMV